jgi:outer membrane protein TolC
MLRFPLVAAVCSGVLLAHIPSSFAEARGADSPAPRAITLPEALAFARANQPAVRAALARVLAQRAEAKIARAQWLPTIGLTAQLFGATANNTTGTYATTSSVMIPRIGGTRSVSDGSLEPYPSTLVAAGAQQELFDFGRIAAQAAAADARVEVETQRARARSLDVTYDVEEAYFAVFAAKAVVKASDDAYDRSRAHRDLARAGVDAGLRPPIELTRAEADLSRFDIGRVRARGGLVVAETVLAAAVGTPDALLDVVDAPPSPDELPGLATAIQQASARDPRLLQALAELKAEEERTTAIGAEMRPDVWLTATISGRAGGATPSGNGELPSGGGWIPNVPNWDLGVVLSWPLFRGTTQARKNASKAEEQARREEIVQVRQEQIAFIRQAFWAVQVARDVLPGLQHAVDAAHANYAQADARFRSGLGTSIELADAEAVRTDAEIRLALGQFELARARAAFGRSIAEGS